MLSNVEAALDGGASLIDFMNDTQQLRPLTKETVSLNRLLICSNSFRGRALAGSLGLRSAIKNSLRALKSR